MDRYGMVKDVVPELNEQIGVSFRGHVMTDRRLQTISSRIDQGRATLEDCHTYAERLGENLSKALTDTLTVDNLPNGKLYYNIAERTVVPALETNYELVNDAASKIQKTIDKRAKIGLGSVRADFPAERVQGLIDKMTAEDITPDRVVSWLTEPIINNSEAFVDDFVEANCKFRSRSGLKTRIVRKAEAKCCDWCAALEGEYDYGSAPDDIYRRHEFCRCSVTFKSEKISQNVWSKNKWETPSEDIERRQQSGSRQEKTVEERLETLAQLERDIDARSFVNETGYSRETAMRATKGKTPEQIAASIQRIKERKKLIGR